MRSCTANPGFMARSKFRCDSHSQFHKRASSVIDYATRQEFKNPDIFFGLSIQVNDDANETTIQQIRDVLKVWPVKVIPRPQIGRVPDGNTTISTITSQNLSPKAGGRAQVNSVHKQTEVDRVHALGIKGNLIASLTSQVEPNNSRTGKGIKIAIMDTGVDYRHEALGGGFGEGFKISFGRDFIGDFYDDTFVLEPDDDPFDFCPEGSPGTHATGRLRFSVLELRSCNQALSVCKIQKTHHSTSSVSRQRQHSECST